MFNTILEASLKDYYFSSYKFMKYFGRWYFRPDKCMDKRDKYCFSTLYARHKIKTYKSLSNSKKVNNMLTLHAVFWSYREEY